MSTDEPSVSRQQSNQSWKVEAVPAGKRKNGAVVVVAVFCFCCCLILGEEIMGRRL